MIIKNSFIKLLTAVLLAFSATLSAEIQIKNGDRIAFLGDTITAQGFTYDSGYITFMTAALKANGINITRIPAGVNASKAPDMLARLQRDVLSKKPKIMILSCGVYDVWHGRYGTPLKKYKQAVTEIVNKAQKAGVKVYILTATMITEKENHRFNRILKKYNDFLRQLAKEKKCTLIDLNKEMMKTLADIRKIYPGVRGNILTYDGVHMNPMGNIMIANAILKTFGLNDEQLAKGAQSWIYRRYLVGDVLNLSVREYLRLSETAFANRCDVLTFVRNIIYRELRKK